MRVQPRDLTYALLSAVGLLIIYGPAFLPWNTFAGMDFLNLFYPDAVFAKRSLGSGIIPLWNWSNWGGAPFLAKLQPAALYPPMWLTLPFELPWALQMSVFVHLSLAGFGVERLARRHFSISLNGSVYAALAYTGSAFIFGHLEQVAHIASVAWTPWIFHAALNTATRRAGPIPFALATAMALLAGHPQYVILTLLFLAIYLLIRTTSAMIGRKQPVQPTDAVAPPVVLSQLFWLAGGVALAGMLSAAQILPTYELGTFSERIWPYPNPHDPHLLASHLPALVIPHYFHQLANTDGRPLGYTELGLYAGLLTFPLFLMGCAGALRRRSISSIPLVLIWGGSLYFALGSVRVAGLELGLAPLILKLVPFLAQSRGAARALNVETLCYALLAARVLTELLASRPWSVRTRELVAWSASVVLTLDLAWTHRRELNSRLVSTEMVTTPLPGAGRTQLAPLFSGQTSSPGRLYRFMAHDSNYYLDDRRAAVVQRRLRLQPNLNIIDRIATLDGYEEGLAPTRSYANFLRRFNRNLRSDSPDAALLALMGSNTMLTEFPPPAQGSSWQPGGRAIATPDGALQLWRSPFPATWLLDQTTLDQSNATSTNLTAYGGTSLDMPPGHRQREPLGQHRRSHPYEEVPPSVMEAAALRVPLSVEAVRTNSLILADRSPSTSEGSPREILFLHATYPGWKLQVPEGASHQQRRSYPVQRVSPIFGTFSWPPTDASTESPAVLAFSPYSFRLGLFLSLSVAALLVAFGLGKTKLRFLLLRS